MFIYHFHDESVLTLIASHVKNLRSLLAVLNKEFSVDTFNDEINASLAFYQKALNTIFSFVKTSEVDPEVCIKLLSYCVAHKKRGTDFLSRFNLKIDEYSYNLRKYIIVKNLNDKVPEIITANTEIMDKMIDAILESMAIIIDSYKRKINSHDEKLKLLSIAKKFKQQIDQLDQALYDKFKELDKIAQESFDIITSSATPPNIYLLEYSRQSMFPVQFFADGMCWSAILNSKWGPISKQRKPNSWSDINCFPPDTMLKQLLHISDNYSFNLDFENGDTLYNNVTRAISHAIDIILQFIPDKHGNRPLVGLILHGDDVDPHLVSIRVIESPKGRIYVFNDANSGSFASYHEKGFKCFVTDELFSPEYQELYSGIKLEVYIPKLQPLVFELGSAFKYLFHIYNNPIFDFEYVYKVAMYIISMCMNNLNDPSMLQCCMLSLIMLLTSNKSEDRLDRLPVEIKNVLETLLAKESMSLKSSIFFIELATYLLEFEETDLTLKILSSVVNQDLKSETGNKLIEQLKFLINSTPINYGRIATLLDDDPFINNDGVSLIYSAIDPLFNSYDVNSRELSFQHWDFHLRRNSIAVTRPPRPLSNRIIDTRSHPDLKKLVFGLKQHPSIEHCDDKSIVFTSSEMKRSFLNKFNTMIEEGSPRRRITNQHWGFHRRRNSIAATGPQRALSNRVIDTGSHRDLEASRIRITKPRY